MNRSKILSVIHVLSKLGFLYAMVLLIPTLVSYAYMDDALAAFSQTAAATLLGSGSPMARMAPATSSV